MTLGVDVSLVTSGHDVADARLHRIVAALVRAGARVEVFGLGEREAGPHGATVVTWPRPGVARRAAVAARMAASASGRVLVALDPDSLLAISASAAVRGRRVVADVHEDYARLLSDRAWARRGAGAAGVAARGVVAAFTAAAAAADLTIVADDHVPPKRARRRVVLRNLPDLTMIPAPTEPIGPPRAVYIGDLRASRGLFAMIGAIQRASQWSLDLVGPLASADRGRVEALLREDGELALRVRLHGRLAPEPAWQLAQGAWAGLLLLGDTPAFREAIPSKLYEYAATGLPVIATDLPRTSGLIRETGAGVLVPGGSDGEVAEAVARVLSLWSEDPPGYSRIRADAALAADRLMPEGAGYDGVARMILDLAGPTVTAPGGGLAAARRQLPEDAKDAVRQARRRLPIPAAELVDRALGHPVPSDIDNVVKAVVAGRPRVDLRAPVRLIVGPANFAGQGHAWARALAQRAEPALAQRAEPALAQRAEPAPGQQRRLSVTSMAVNGPIPFRVDYRVAPSAYRSLRWQRDQLAWLTSTFTHALIEAERPLTGTLYGGNCAGELPRLRSAGMQLAFISHGSDIRLPSRHAAHFPQSPFADPTDPRTAGLEKQALRNQAILRQAHEAGDPVFVSTPDLLDDAPYATWCPTVVDLDEWAPDATAGEVMSARRPVVVHIPSNPQLKGSALVEPVLREMEAAGLIEYRALTGIARDELVREVKHADIVLDQFVMGLYGVAALEALAAGRLAVGFVGDVVRQRVAATTGWQVPIIEATPATVREVLSALLDDRDAAREHAASGPAFVRAAHDGRFSAQVLASFSG